MSTPDSKRNPSPRFRHGDSVYHVHYRANATVEDCVSPLLDPLGKFVTHRYHVIVDQCKYSHHEPGDEVIWRERDLR